MASGWFNRVKDLKEINLKDISTKVDAWLPNLEEFGESDHANPQPPSSTATYIPSAPPKLHVEKPSPSYNPSTSAPKISPKNIKKDNDVTEEKLRQRVIDLQEEVEAFEKVKMNLNLSFQIQMDWVRKDKEQWVTKSKELESQNEKLNHRIAELERDVLTLNQNYKELEEKLKNQEEKTADAEKRATESEQKVTQLSDSMTLKISEKDKELEEILSIAKDDREKRMTEIERLQNEIRSILNRNEKDQDKKNHGGSSKSLVNEEEGLWKERFRTLSDQFASLQEQNERMKKENESLSTQFQIVKDRIDLIRRKEIEVEKSSGTTGNDDSRTKSLIKQLQTALAQREQDQHMYEAQSEAQKKMIKNLQQELASAQSDTKMIKEGVYNACLSLEQDQLAPVVASILQFTPEEVNAISRHRRNSLKGGSSSSSSSPLKKGATERK